MATVKRKWVVVNGPSLLEGIILGHWRDGNCQGGQEERVAGRPEVLPYFTLEVGRTFSARIHGIFQVPHRRDTVILLGEFAGEKLDGCDYFVMYYGVRGRHTGLLEPLEQLHCDNPMLNEFFPTLFKKPAPIPENPVLAHLRSLPWEKKMELVEDFMNARFHLPVETAIAHQYVFTLFRRVKLPDQQVSTEIDQNPNFDIDRLADEFWRMCPTVNNFFRELGMEYFLTSGGRMAGGKLGSVIISLGPKNEIDFD